MGIKETLISKISSLEEDRRFQLHRQAVATNVNPARNYVWSHDADGFYMLSPGRGVYLSHATGIVHRARLADSDLTVFDLEHKKHILLHKLASTRMDIPVHFEYASLFNQTWAYSIVERPNKQLGVGFQIDTTLLGQNLTSLFSEAIVQHKNLLVALPKVVAELGDGLPKYCQPGKYLRDDVGLFATGFKSWQAPSDTFIAMQYDKIKERLTEWNALSHPEKRIDIQSMIDFATDTWGEIDGYK